MDKYTERMCAGIEMADLRLSIRYWDVGQDIFKLNGTKMLGREAHGSGALCHWIVACDLLHFAGGALLSFSYV